MEHHCWGFPLDQGTWMHCIGFPLDCVCPASSSAGKKGFRANGLRNSRNGEEVTNGSEVKTKGATHCWGFPLDRGTWMHCIGFPLDCVCPASSSAGKKGFRANGLRNSRNGEEVTNGSEVKTKGATHCWGFPLDRGTWMHCIGFPLDCVCPASSSAGKKGFRANGLRNSRNGEEVTNGSEVKTKGATHCWGFPLDRGTWMHCIGFPLDCVCPASSSAGKKGFRANGLRNSRNGEEVTNGSEVKTKGAT